MTTTVTTTTRSSRRYGWTPDLPDQRDYLYAVAPEALAPEPAHLDLRDSGLLAFSYDQGDMGACVWNATASAIRYTWEKANGGAAHPGVLPSRLFGYYMTRRLEGTVGWDSGCTIRDALKVSTKVGYVPEAEWPYEDSLLYTTPPTFVQDKAHSNRVTSYLRVPRNVKLMRACLIAGFPFLFGVSIYESFEQATNGEVPMPGRTEKLLGGHALLAVGYDLPSTRFIFMNWWGDTWGQGGYGTIPMQYLASGTLSRDTWTIRQEAEAA